jgi:hypothetical protein
VEFVDLCSQRDGLATGKRKFNSHKDFSGDGRRSARESDASASAGGTKFSQERIPNDDCGRGTNLHEK